MDKKIYLSPSSQPTNTYAAGNTNEQKECRKMARATASALKRCGFDVVCADYGTMYSRVAESNEWGADLHVPIHTNGFNEKVTGTRIMCYDTSGEGYKAAKSVFNELAPVTPGISENITAQPGLYEINKSNAPCVYVEVDFHDVPDVAQWLIDNTVRIGEAICKGICNHFGIEYIEQEQDSSGVSVYRVQVGAFLNRDLAESLRDELKEKGYDAFIV